MTPIFCTLNPSFAIRVQADRLRIEGSQLREDCVQSYLLRLGITAGALLQKSLQMRIKAAIAQTSADSLNPD